MIFTFIVPTIEYKSDNPEFTDKRITPLTPRDRPHREPSFIIRGFRYGVANTDFLEVARLQFRQALVDDGYDTEEIAIILERAQVQTSE